MTSRERVLRTLQHQEPDRIPLDLGSEVTSIHKTAHRNLKEHLGFEGGEEVITDSVQQVVKPDERILRRFDIDVRHIALRSAVPWRKIGEGLYRDEWGIVYREQSGYCEMIGHPLAEIDDIGTQSGPLLSPDLYRKLIKPRQKRLYARIKEKTDAKLFLHACGSVYPFIEDFIDNGIDALNPVQFSATDMQPERLKREFGGRLTFWGAGCDTQRVLPLGTPEEVEQEVRTRIDQFAPGGGFVFSAVHNIQYDVPPQNIVTMYDTARTYGTY